MLQQHKYIAEFHHQNYKAWLDLAREWIIGTPLKEFSFQRFYVGGKHLSFFSHSQYVEFYFENRRDLSKVFFDIIIDLEEGERKYFFWPPDTDDPTLLRVASFGMYEFISIFERHQDYVNVYHFSGTQGYDMQNYYINNLDFLSAFGEHLSKGVSDFIGYDQKKILGQHTGNYVLENFTKPSIKRTYDIQLGNQKVILTPREYACLTLISKGHSAKWIANHLDVSHRTVETHIGNVRKKSCLHSKDKLVSAYHRSFTRI